VQLLKRNRRSTRATIAPRVMHAAATAFSSWPIAAWDFTDRHLVHTTKYNMMVAV
jgi:hypothetical protein